MTYHRRSGSVIVEFLFVFPAFLVLSLFTIEVALMWSDRHVTKLAAYEAARSLASAPLPETLPQGGYTNDPCQAPEAMAAAKRAATRKMAIITPSIFYFNARLGDYAFQGLEPFETALAQLGPVASRLLSRWPTAVTLSKLNCTYDQSTKNITTDITYYRAPATPIVGRLMWVVHILQKAASSSSPLEVSLTHDFFGLEGKMSPAERQQLQQTITKNFGVIRQTAMQTQQASQFIGSIPGIKRLLGNIVPPLVFGLQTATRLQQVEYDTQAAFQQLSQATAQAGNFSQLLGAAIYATPEALRFIPMHVKSYASRDILGPHARNTSQHAEDEAWQAQLRGVADLNSGVFKPWSRQMSVNPQYMDNGVSVYALP